MRVLRACLLASVVLVPALLASSPAAAHSACDKPVPADGSTHATAPKSVSCDFTEPPTQDSTMWIEDACGRRADHGHSTVFGVTMSVDMTADAPSLYTVHWKATSQVDGHKSFGSWSFTVEGHPAACTARSSVPTTVRARGSGRARATGAPAAVRPTTRATSPSSGSPSSGSPSSGSSSGARATTSAVAAAPEAAIDDPTDPTGRAPGSPIALLALLAVGLGGILLVIDDGERTERDA